MENKLNRYYNYVVDDLIKGTRHWSKDSNPTHHIGVNFPMYDIDELEFYYTEEEIEEWLHRGWLIGSDDIKYLDKQYGLTEDESRRVMDMYGVKLATLLLSKYGG
jgi:hypothetical protein